jgi:hypothetical protein
LTVYSLPGVIEHNGLVLMRTILFAVALLIFTASAHAAGPAPKGVECKDSTAQIDGHEVTITCYPETGFISEDWRKDGKLDRADGPASIARDTATGTITGELWFKDDKLGRADGPARIHRDAATGKVTFEGWYKDNLPDRADGPALIERDPTTGIVTREAWWSDGKQIAPPSSGTH